jgi:hypothetical protein
MVDVEMGRGGCPELCHISPFCGMHWLRTCQLHQLGGTKVAATKGSIVDTVESNIRDSSIQEVKRFRYCGIRHWRLGQFKPQSREQEEFTPNLYLGESSLRKRYHFPDQTRCEHLSNFGLGHNLK